MEVRMIHTRSTPLVRLGLLAGCTTALAAGLMFLGHSASHAEAATLSADQAAGFQTTDKLLININLVNPDARKLQGVLRLELVGPENKVLTADRKTIDQVDLAASYRFELPASHLAANKLTLRCSFNKENFSVPLNKILVVKAHETSVTSGQEFHVGSSASLRCGVHGVKSLTETIPLAGSTVAIELQAKDGKVYPLHTGKTGADGWDKAEFKVPSVPSGQYTLQVVTKSTFGEEKLERNVQVKNTAKVLLVTDKPLYQPGQLMHIRALTLRPMDLKPVAGADLVFEVEDGKGNKVFKRTQRTSDYGIATIDFQLADEVNMGDYRVRATVADRHAEKTVGVKRYVLPKFKVNLTADKSYYLPKETIKGEIQTDYFFGKPVAKGNIEVAASTFDVQFRAFQTWKGTTDASGHAKFEIKLPDYFVGQPLQKGDALVKLEVKVTDTADHTETITKTYPVSDMPIRVSLIPEGGRLVPDMENRIYVAAIYPDGSPAAGEVAIWASKATPLRPQRIMPKGEPPPPADDGHEKQGDPLVRLKTNAAGLAEFRLTPKTDQFYQGQWEQRTIEMAGGQTIPVGSPKLLLNLLVEARDSKGTTVSKVMALNGDVAGENVLLRLDKAIYRTGDTLAVDLRSSAGLPTAYLDLVKGGQTVLTRWLDVKDGKASYKLDLPSEIFGTVEVHAYQMLQSGEIIRDSRVVYVQPSQDLKVDVKADKDVHVPGETGQIRFQVTNASGAPAPAALGVIIVDESVYALQEMQPGLEKVYFTLQEELLKPQGQVVYKPAQPLDTLVLETALPAPQQQIAQVLLTSVKPKPPARWEVAPEIERRHKMDNQLQQIGWALYSFAVQNRSFMERDPKTQRWVFKSDLLQELVKSKQLPAAALQGPFGTGLTLEELARLEKDFTVDHLAEMVTTNRMQQLMWAIGNYTNANRAKFLKDGKWNLPDTILAEAAKHQRLDGRWLEDAWGQPIRLVKRDQKAPNNMGWPQFDFYELVSAGPDGKFGTDDDVKQSDPKLWARLHGGAWYSAHNQLGRMNGDFRGRGGVRRLQFGAQGGFGGDGMAPGAAVPLAANAAAPTAAPKALEAAQGEGRKTGAVEKEGGGAQPARIREYFPETMLWQPALITDDKGVAVLPLTFADSITTWRLSASASSQGGALGGVTTPLRVFQDFFVDIDLPVSLTQNDEVAFPVAVYNYLKTPQTVKLDLQPEPWFELIDSGGYSRSLDLQPNEVTAVKFRIRAKRIGYGPLTVKASGSKMSDAIKRSIEVVPDGQKVEQVVTDRLEGTVTKTITIPNHALPDASKILVKVYPGVMSQVLEGTEGMLRLPGG
jgi:hypothetical protein